MLHRFRIEAIHDILGRARGHEEAVPRRHFHTRKPGFGKCRHVGQFRRALRAHDGKRLDLASLDERHRRRRGVEVELDLPADEIGERLCGALVWNVNGLGACGQIERLAGEMLRAADAR